MSNIVPFDQMESMASYIVRSKLFGAKDESQAMSLMLLAQAEGMHPMSAIQDFDIVQGRPARKTHSILARFQAAGGKVAWQEITATRACGVFSHPQGGSLEVEWTFEQAQKIGGLTSKDNWKNYPKAMLRARCIAEGVRAVFPGAIGGMMSVEEAHDAEPPARQEIDITPQPVVKKCIGAKGFAAALDSIRAGEYTAELLRQNYTLADEQEAELAALLQPAADDSDVPT